MCDTFALMVNGQTYFGKNSDREPDEPQFVEWHDSVSPAKTQLTYIPVQRSKQTVSTWISRPSWMWGAEMGMNEYGVCIGNEAVFTQLIEKRKTALLGMDLLRLALEESKSAIQALHTITGYLEEYGQGGAAGFKNKNFKYDNSFLIADSHSVWKLETAGQLWVAKEYTHGEQPQQIAISNHLSIETDFDLHSENLFSVAKAKGYWNGNDDFNFKDCFATWFMPWAGKADKRKQSNISRLKQVDLTQNIPAQLAKILQQHVKGEQHSGNGDVCMHSTGILRPSATTQSMVAELKGRDSLIWMTGSPTPCQSLYQPLTHDQKSMIYMPNFWHLNYHRQQACKHNPAKLEQLKRINRQYQAYMWGAESSVVSQHLNAWWLELNQL